MRKRRFYDSRRWRRLRIQHISIQPLCGPCEKRGVTRAGQEVDHITPVSQGGEPYDMANLQSMCKECHSRKTAKDAGKVVGMGSTVDGKPSDPSHPWNQRPSEQG